MSNTKKILVVSAICVIALIMYETFFIIKIKEDSKKKASNVQEHQSQNIFPQFKETKPDSFNLFDNNFSFLNSLQDIEEYHKKFQKYFNDIIKDNFLLLEKDLAFNTFIEESDSKYIIKLKIPGYENKEIDIELKNNSLVISGKHSVEEKKDKLGFYKNSFGSFKKIIPIPGNIKADQVESKYENGFLTIILPKDNTIAPQYKPEKEAELI